MNVEDIARLCGGFSIREKERPVRQLDSLLKDEGEQRLALCLVGKVLATKLVNRNVFIDVMNKIWRVEGGVEIEQVKSNIFKFGFKTLKDRQRILKGGLWSFDRAIIVFEIPTGEREVEGMNFNSVDFWVRIHNLPLLCMTKEIEKFLGNMIGVVKEIDFETTSDGSGWFLRVRVTVQANEPLQQCIRVDLLGTGKSGEITEGGVTKKGMVVPTSIREAVGTLRKIREERTKWGCDNEGGKVLGEEGIIGNGMDAVNTEWTSMEMIGEVGGLNTIGSDGSTQKEVGAVGESRRERWEKVGLVSQWIKPKWERLKGVGQAGKGDRRAENLGEKLEKEADNLKSKIQEGKNDVAEIRTSDEYGVAYKDTVAAEPENARRVTPKREFRNSNPEVRRDVASDSIRRGRWIPPDIDEYKANCDAVLDQGKGTVGIGMIIRNSDGNVLVGGSIIFAGTFSIKIAKLMAILRCIQFGNDCGLRLKKIESDEATVVKWIKEGLNLESEYGTVSSTSKATTQNPSVLEVPYMTARVSHFEFSYSFPVVHGRKFVYLHFCSNSYNGLDVANVVFSVTAYNKLNATDDGFCFSLGSYSLLKNFSTVQTTKALNYA
ncbi:hypothetical protein EZV62_015535 [Acer yangbiense]|uniref:DUF4283 domain-containing protein n=1 Tax=Acer yangbiense TaxID=1000413 RepID=A0A5C7HN25_9ROSI|nr:hypothetical protein EZV62_015535 [Acer yangbiense]